MNKSKRRSVPLPATMDWYRDLTRWLVTVSAGAIVFGFGIVTAGPTDTGELTGFTASSAVLLLCMIAGLGYYVELLTYANALEVKQYDIPDDKLELLEKRVERGHRWMAICWHLMLWPFLIGFAVFVGFCAYRL